MAGTFGHGVWIADLATASTDVFKKESMELKGEQTWTSNKDLNTDVYLKKNSKLTIKNASIAMAKATTFYIEDGAALILDNSKLGTYAVMNGLVYNLVAKKGAYLKND